MLGTINKIFKSLKQDKSGIFDRLDAPKTQGTYEPVQVEDQPETMQVSEIVEDIQEIDNTEDFLDLFEVLDKVERPTSKQIVKAEVNEADNKVVNIAQFRKAAPKTETSVDAKEESAGDMCALPDNLISNDWSKGRAIVDWTRAQ